MTTLTEPLGECSACRRVRAVSDLATVNEVPYCHGEFDRTPTCYQRHEWEITDD